MSIFSKIKLSRKAAKKHNTKAPGEDVEQPAKVPYKHIPTHAAIDALNGVPSSWRQEDLPKIKEHYQRRSQAVISRTASSVSTTSFRNAAAGPSAPPLPRPRSYHTHNSTWYNRDGEAYYFHEPTQRRRRPRSHSYHDSGIGPSPLATEVPSEAPSRLASSDNSSGSTSSDNLELSPAPKGKRTSQSVQPVVRTQNDIFDRLHTSTSRKLGEAPLYDSPPVVVKPNVDIAVPVDRNGKPKWSLMGKRNAATIAV